MPEGREPMLDYVKFKHILFAQMCKKDKTQVKQTYEVFSYIQ